MIVVLFVPFYYYDVLLFATLIAILCRTPSITCNNADTVKMQSCPAYEVVHDNVKMQSCPAYKVVNDMQYCPAY